MTALTGLYKRAADGAGTRGDDRFGLGTGRAKSFRQAMGEESTEIYPTGTLGQPDLTINPARKGAALETDEMATTTAQRIAKGVLSDLHDLCERLRSLKPAEERELANLLRAVYRYTIIDGNNSDPPLGVGWSLRDGDIAKTIFENITGESVE